MKSDPAGTRARLHRHPMRVVTRRTGLSAELLRVWERRYGVVAPARTQTGRRLYSDAEIERLRLLYRATLAGRSIGSIAPLSTPALATLVRQDTGAEAREAARDAAPNADGPHAARSARFVAAGLRAVERFDPDALHALLRRAAITLSSAAFLERVVAPLLERVGTRWREGTLQSVHGHLTAAAVRRALELATDAASRRAARPGLLIATLAGQMHELGAMLATAAAAAEGWSVTYLGPNLPAEDIAAAARLLRARAVGLSLVHPPNDPAVSHELRRLRSLLPSSVRLIAGGAAAEGYESVLDEIGATRVATLDAWLAGLRALRTRSNARRRRPLPPPAAARKRRRTGSQGGNDD